MAVITISSGYTGKVKKKVGWKRDQKEHEEWLAKVNSMTLGIRKANVVKPIKQPVHFPVRRNHTRPQSLGTFGGVGGKPVIRPDVLYKDDPELLQRELKARERKFNVAPAYNKGGDVFVTEEELVNQLKGNKRRI